MLKMNRVINYRKAVSQRVDATLSNQIYEELKRQIIDCWILPGQMVYANEIAENLKVSKVPVREAIKRLMQEGLIQSIPAIGHIVTPITLKNIRDLFELRRILEAGAVQRAAEVATDVQIDQVEKLVGTPYPLDSQESHIEWQRGNVKFHVAIAEISGNEKMVRHIRTVMEEMSRISHMNVRMRVNNTSMIKEHLEIVQALRRRDGKVAVMKAMDAIDETLRLVQQSLSIGEEK